MEHESGWTKITLKNGVEIFALLDNFAFSALEEHRLEEMKIIYPDGGQMFEIRGVGSPIEVTFPVDEIVSVERNYKTKLEIK